MACMARSGLVLLSLAVLVPAAALGAGNQVGVIMGSEGCPGGAAPLYIHFDNEDHNNGNDRGGWIGSTVSNGNTTFYFCRVSGNAFSPIGQPYMVLSLGSQCPSGSQTILRRFDCEDRRPASSSNINGSLEGLPGAIVWDTDVFAYFCLFHGLGGTWGSLPNLGVEYGVFAAPNFAPALDSGFVYLDDENDLYAWGTGINFSRWCEDLAWQTGGPRYLANCVPRETGNYWDPWTSPYRAYVEGDVIMDGGLNSVMRIVKAKGPHCGNGICVAGETCSSCAPDCGTCPSCGDGTCNGGEWCMTCPSDCGPCAFCGDGFCSPGEDCCSCGGDCGICGPDQYCAQ